MTVSNMQTNLFGSTNWWSNSRANNDADGGVSKSGAIRVDSGSALANVLAPNVGIKDNVKNAIEKRVDAETSAYVNEIKQVADVAASLAEDSAGGFSVNDFVTVGIDGTLKSANSMPLRMTIDGVSRNVGVTAEEMAKIYSSYTSKPYNAADGDLEVDAEKLKKQYIEVDGELISVYDYITNNGGELPPELKGLSIDNPEDLQKIAEYFNNQENGIVRYVKNENYDAAAANAARASAFARVMNDKIEEAFGEKYRGIASVSGDGKVFFSSPGSKISVHMRSESMTSLDFSEAEAASGNLAVIKGAQAKQKTQDVDNDDDDNDDTNNGRASADVEPLSYENNAASVYISREAMLMYSEDGYR